MSKGGRAVVFEGQGAALVIEIPPDRDVADGEILRAVDEFKRRVRAAWAAGGCRSFTVGVHEAGPECDHERGGK